jgi:hypothetical protein
MASFGRAASPFTPQRTLTDNPSRYLHMKACVTRMVVVRNQCNCTIQTKYVQKYIYNKLQRDPLMVGFIAAFEQTSQLQHFLCANSTKIPNIDREIK